MDVIKSPHVERILCLTALASGTVDIISFATLGRIFASAMTGNFALLAYYVAKGNSPAAFDSIVALAGFVAGCALGVLLRRGRAERQSLTLLLAGEFGLLLFFAMRAVWMEQLPHTASGQLQILLLAIAMGLQAVLGQMISLTTIVFTTTLTRLVSAITDSIASRDRSALKDIKIQAAVVAAYVLGASMAGALLVHDVRVVVFLPCVSVAAALAVHSGHFGSSIA